MEDYFYHFCMLPTTDKDPTMIDNVQKTETLITQILLLDLYQQKRKNVFDYLVKNHSEIQLNDGIFYTMCISNDLNRLKQYWSQFKLNNRTVEQSFFVAVINDRIKLAKWLLGKYYDLLVPLLPEIKKTYVKSKLDQTNISMILILTI